MEHDVLVMWLFALHKNDHFNHLKETLFHTYNMNILTEGTVWNVRKVFEQWFPVLHRNISLYCAHRNCFVACIQKSPLTSAMTTKNENAARWNKRYFCKYGFIRFFFWMRRFDKLIVIHTDLNPWYLGPPCFKLLTNITIISLWVRDFHYLRVAGIIHHK